VPQQMAARDGRSRQNYLQEHSIPQLFEVKNAFKKG